MIVIKPNTGSFGGIERTIELLRARAGEDLSIYGVPGKPIIRGWSDVKLVWALSNAIKLARDEPIFVRNFYTLFWVWVARLLAWSDNRIYYQSPGVYPVQIFYQFHALGVSERFSRSLAKVFSLLELFLISRCAGIFVFNEFLKDNYRLWYPARSLAGKLRVIRPGLDYDWGLSETEIDVRMDGPELLYFGRLDGQKGLDKLVSCMVRYPDLRLKIIGAGRSEAALREFAQGAANIEFVAPIRDKRKLACEIMSARFSIVPSVYEPYGHVVWEVISLGGTVLTVDRPSGKFTGHGFLESGHPSVCSFKDVEALVDFAACGDREEPVLSGGGPDRTWDGYIRELVEYCR